jgi:Ras family protein
MYSGFGGTPRVTAPLEYKLLSQILAGDGGVGKTAFLTRHRTDEFDEKYIATIGAAVHHLVRLRIPVLLCGLWVMATAWLLAVPVPVSS